MKLTIAHLVINVVAIFIFAIISAYTSSAVLLIVYGANITMLSLQLGNIVNRIRIIKEDERRVEQEQINKKIDEMIYDAEIYLDKADGIYLDN